MASKLVISNFKYGLDGRRNELTSQPGTMVQATNGFINQGGEFEKRKAFSLLGTLPTGCYGIQETSSGLFTFGNGAASIATTNRKTAGTNVATITFALAHGYSVGQTVRVAGVGGATAYNGTQVITAVTQKTISYAVVGGTNENTPDTGGTVTFPINLPTGVSYQRLRHYLFDTFETSSFVFDLDGYFDEPAMTGVVSSCSYKGNAFVVATFGPVPSNGNGALAASTQMFYAGRSVIEQNVGQEFLGNPESYFISIQLFSALPHYFGTDFNAVYSVNSFQLTGPVGTAFTISFTATQALNSTAGYTIPQDVKKGSATNATTAVSSVVKIYLTSGASGSISVLTAPDCSTGAVSGTVDLIGATQNFSSSLLITAQNIAAVINSRTVATGGYTASAALVNGPGTKVAVLAISAPTAYGAVPNASNLSVTSATIKVSATSIASTGATGAQTFAFAGGVTATVASGQTDLIDFNANTGGAWAQGTTWQGTLIANNIEYTIGSGNIGGVIPNFCMALGRKLYFLAADTFYFSAINDATKWEDQDTGAGFVQVSDQFASPTNLVALAAYQGKLAVFSRWNIQVWNINADPAQYSQSQSLQNIGTFAPLSVQSVGDLDVLFLSDTGVRSLRVRDSSLNGYIVDLGSSVDSFIQTDVQALGAGASAACGIVEPLTNNYWLHVNGNIYVLAYYPSLKITAWSKYLPTYETFTGPITGVGSGFTNTFSNLTIGTRYYWIPDAGAINLVCGTTNVNVAGWFIANATTAVVTNHVGSGSFTDTLLLATQTAFTPKKFLIFQGQVYCLDTNGKLFVYGGTNNNTYDSCVATGELPWLDGKTPNIVKKGQRIDAAFQGMWTVEYGLDPKATTSTQVVVPINLGAVGDGGTDSTFDESQFSTSGFKGTHHKVLFYTSPNWANVARFSAVTFQYDGGHEA